jgi:hypothetical protein
MDNPEDYQKIFKLVQSISYIVGIFASTAILVRVVNATGVDL